MPFTPTSDWLPVTPELLDRMAAHNQGQRYWIKCNTMDEPVAGDYTLDPARRGHGFDLDNGARWRAADVTHIKPCRS